MPRPVTSGRVGTTSRLASGDTSEVLPNWTRATGAVPTLAATETAMLEAMDRGRRPRSLCKRPMSAIMPTKAANESWKPTSKSANGFRARIDHRGQRQDLPLIAPAAHPASEQHYHDHDRRPDDRAATPPRTGS